jgi:two-component system response regulator AtoC
MKKILIIDDEEDMLQSLRKILSQRSTYQVTTIQDSKQAMQLVLREKFDLILTDLKMGEVSGIDILKAALGKFPDAKVIMISGYGTIEASVEAMQEGAFDFIEKPFTSRKLFACIDRVFGQLTEAQSIPIDIQGKGTELTGIIYKSQQIADIISLIGKIAPGDLNVLITGESGTGKELIARAIHNLSKRSVHPFVPVNCGALPENLFESELFGHEKGAFTGAVTSKVGLLETAQGGTVFLDEIGEMPLSMQVKLLRVIQERQIVRVGGNRPIDLNVRFLAASNQDLKQEMQAGRFRGDLYFRLNVVEINLPRLRDRQEDILPLINYFLTFYSSKFGKNISGMDKETRQLLLGYSYPGNVRELANIIERAVALADQDVLRMNDLPLQVQSVEAVPAPGWVRLADREREYIRQVLQATRNNIKKAAEILDVPHTTLWRKIKKYGLSSS